MSRARNMLERLSHEVAVGADPEAAATMIRKDDEEQSLERARALDADEVARRAGQRSASRSEPAASRNPD